MPIKRYEILLPLRYNDGSPVEPEKFEQTRHELIDRFHGATFDPQPVRAGRSHLLYCFQGNAERAVSAN